jgi:stage V sporulation protein S
MRVSATSDPASLGGAIAQIVRRDASASLSAIGAAAVNQAVKGVAVAAGFLTVEGVSIAMVPSFAMVDIDGKERTSICLRVVCV